MDFWNLARLMVRRWYLSVPMLLLATAATLYVANDVEPDYAITSYVQLIPPSGDAVAGGNLNPWLDLGLPALSHAAALATGDRTFMDALARHGEASFGIETTDDNPIVAIEVVAPSLAQVRDASARVVAQYENSVITLQRQYGVNPKNIAMPQQLDLGENVSRAGGKIKRSIVAVGLIGLLGAVGGVAFIDSVGRRLRRRWESDRSRTEQAQAGRDRRSSSELLSEVVAVAKAKASAGRPQEEPPSPSRPVVPEPIPTFVVAADNHALRPAEDRLPGSVEDVPTNPAGAMDSTLVLPLGRIHRTRPHRPTSAPKDDGEREGRR